MYIILKESKKDSDSLFVNKGLELKGLSLLIPNKFTEKSV